MSRKPTSSSARPRKGAKEPSPLIKYYLITYNLLSALGWGYVLLTLLSHLLNLRSTPPPTSTTAFSTFSTFSTYISRFTSVLPIPPITSSPFRKRASAYARYIPKSFLPFVQRAATAYGSVGVPTALVQTAAVMEVVHAALGWVSSPVGTTAAQVASRLFAVWGVVELYEVARTSPIYATMVLAWSLTEVIRYPFYALSLLDSKPYPLLYLRYTTFYVLYPLGAFSEAYLNYLTLPKSNPIPSLQSWAFGAVWTPYDLFRGVLLLVWPPSLYVLYTYMIRQRRKTLGTGRRLGAKPKSL